MVGLRAWPGAQRDRRPVHRHDDLRSELRTLDEHTLRRLIEVGRALTSELEPEVVLRRVLHTARELTGAREAALDLEPAARAGLEGLLTLGGDARAHEELRAEAVVSCPIGARGQAFGTLRLVRKAGGAPFDESDRASAAVLAGWAGTAIENARLYRRAERRRRELERAVQGLEATVAVARALGGETELDRVLELIAVRGRSLVAARSLVILLEEAGELRAAAAVGEVAAETYGARLPVAGSAPGALLESLRPERVEKPPPALREALGELGLAAEAALLVPLAFRGSGHGVLCALDRLDGGPAFDEEDQRLLEAFAAAGGTAVATARTIERDRLRHSIEAEERERRRWARELHDQTLQGLGGLQVLLSAALASGSPERLGGAVREAIDRVGGEIAALRGIIADLRPAALDELGAKPAIESLAERTTETAGMEVETFVDLDFEAGRRATRHRPEVESALYRIVQEGLTNAAKHSRASRVRVWVIDLDDAVEVAIADDGVGFDSEAATEGFGLVGMRERALLAGGRFEVLSSPGAGTTLSVVLPAPRPDVPSAP